MHFPETDAALGALPGIVLVAGLVRGLSGFGTGMIVMPVAAPFYFAGLIGGWAMFPLASE